MLARTSIPEINGGNLSEISVKVPIQFKSNAGTIVSADYATRAIQ